MAYALGNGMIVLASQYWGQKRLKEIRQLSSIALRGEILLSLLLFALVSLFPAGTLRLFTSQPMFISEGVKYLNIIRFSYLFFTLTDPNTGELVFSRTSEEHERVVAQYRPLWEQYDREHGN